MKYFGYLFKIKPIVEFLTTSTVMKTIPEVVEKIILEKPFLHEALAEGLVNVSSLARKIQPEIITKTYVYFYILGSLVRKRVTVSPQLFFRKRCFCRRLSNF